MYKWINKIKKLIARAERFLTVIASVLAILGINVYDVVNGLPPFTSIYNFLRYNLFVMEVWHLFVILILAFLIKFFYNKWGRFPVPIKRKPNHSNLQPTIADDMRPKEDGKIKEKKAITPLQTIPLNNGEDNDVFVHWRISDMFEKRDTHPELYKIYETIRDFQYVESIFSPIKIINELRLIMRDYSEKPDYCLDKIKNEYINKNADSNYKYRQKHKETGRIIVECLKRLIIDKDCKFWWLFEQDRELKNNLSSEIQKVFFEKLDIKNQSDTELKK